MMIVIVRRLIMSDGNLTATLDRVLNRGASRSVPQGWARPTAGALGAAVRGPGVRGPGGRGPDQRPSPPDGES
jgi:hypothetical protein